MYASDASQNQSPDPGFIDSAMTATQDVDGMMQELNNLVSVHEDYLDLGVSFGAEEAPSNPSVNGDNHGSPVENTANVDNQGTNQLEEDYIHAPLGNPLDMDSDY